MSEAVSTETKPRLKFIDLARAIAILLMLEGHFVGLVLGDQYRGSGHPVYVVWNFIRGFTAPLFFTVAGIIFTYLLSGETEPDFFRRKRVRKGIKRAVELLFWGYMLQLSVQNLGAYLRLDFEGWVFAFHVLQCIGVGLIALMAIAAVQHRAARIPLAWWYVAALVATLWVYVWLKKFPGNIYLPEGWPQIFQNAIRGPRSAFPLFPWLAFAFLGGAIGVAVRKYRDVLVTSRSCLWFVALAVLLKAVWVAVSLVPGLDAATVRGLCWFTERAAEVVAFLGLLRWVEIRFGIGIPRVLSVGRQTFEIYIIHVVVLYGGIFGVGLNRWLAGKLNPWQAAGGAAVFLLIFFALAQAVEAWKVRKRA